VSHTVSIECPDCHREVSVILKHRGDAMGHSNCDCGLVVMWHVHFRRWNGATLAPLESEATNHDGRNG